MVPNPPLCLAVLVCSGNGVVKDEAKVITLQMMMQKTGIKTGGTNHENESLLIRHGQEVNTWINVVIIL